MNSADCGHQALLVSMATETKESVAARATYFVVLLTAVFRLLRRLSSKSVEGVTPHTYRRLTRPKRAVCHESTEPESLRRIFYRQPSIVRWVPCLPYSVPSWQLAKSGHWAMSGGSDGVHSCGKPIYAHLLPRPLLCGVDICLFSVDNRWLLELPPLIAGGQRRSAVARVASRRRV